MLGQIVSIVKGSRPRQKLVPNHLCSTVSALQERVKGRVVPNLTDQFPSAMMRISSDKYSHITPYGSL